MQEDKQNGENTRCPVCEEFIPPGGLHSCAGPSYRSPTMAEMLAELKLMRALLERAAGPKPETKAHRRETR